MTETDINTTIEEVATIELEVFRYRPEKASAPSFDTFTVPLHDEWVLLDALNHIKDEIDGSLSYRWSCRMGVCGSCGMMANGEAVLTCAAFLKDYAPGPIRIEPLANFPVARDLIVGMDDFMEKLNRVKPWVINENGKSVEEGEYLQTPEELDDYVQYTMCINCMLCYSACPIYGMEPSFIGPAALALAQRYNLDLRDHGNEERMDILSSDEGIWQCTFVGECSEVCPKHVDPAGAIQRYKVEATNNWWKSKLMPWSN
jgi:fumarate reductase iron-sulfur subunit